MASEPVCVVDFCGRWNRIPMVQFWADWYPADRIVRFGGWWEDLPPMPADSEPTDDDVTFWAAQHGETVGIPFDVIARASR